MQSMNLSEGSLLKSGEYRIVKTLGQGGFGITYEAEQVSLGRSVAIKEFFMKEFCYRDEKTSHVSVSSEVGKELVDRFRSKFLREARMIARFNNPHIVKIHDVFEENGTAYYVMEYIANGSLYDKVKNDGALPETEAEKYIRQIASALAYIHNQNILHLDVKPANILLNDADFAVLVDFGISKHYDCDGEQTSSTPLGLSKGYAPLEQYQQGDVNRFTPSTDIYSLGATLFYTVSGLTPPDAPSVYEDGLEKPSMISDKVWAAIEHSMQPRRKDRPQNIESFLSLLDGSVAITPQNVQADEETVITSRKKSKTDAIKDIETKDAEETKLEVVEPNKNDVNNKIENNINIPEYVDLGLSVKWATYNVGATKPEDYGDIFAWGEIIPKKMYYPYNYKHLETGNVFKRDKLLKYNNDKATGVVDNKTELESNDDAAFVSWGQHWRMPTEKEIDELIDNCNWVWTILNGVYGCKVISNVPGYKEKYIFLPATGWCRKSDHHCAGEGGYYWSSSLYYDHPHLARCFFFDSSFHTMCSSSRFSGRYVRPVCP